MSLNSNKTIRSGEDFIDIKSVVDFFLLYRAFFFISIVITILISAAHNEFTTPVYQVQSSILFPERKTQPADMATFLYGSQFFIESIDFNNEILVLQSSSLVQEVIAGHNFTVSYFKQEEGFPNNLFFNLKEIYNDTPFRVLFDHRHPQPVNALFNIIILDEQEFFIKAEAEDVLIYNYENNRVTNKIPGFDISGNHLFGEEIKNTNYSFQIILNSNYNREYHNDRDLFFKFHSPGELVATFSGSLHVEPQELNSTIAQLNLRGPNIDKSTDFLNALMEKYMERNLNKKNYQALATISNIDAQLSNITDSLAHTEMTLENFRRNFQVMDISEKSNRLLQQLQVLEDENAELVKKSRLYRQLQEYFKANLDTYELLSPSSMGIEDPNLNNLIMELISLNSELKTLVQSDRERSPRFQTLILQVNNLKGTIIENINYLINTSRIQLEDIGARIAQLENEMDRLPQTKRLLLGIERQFDINDAVYTFLLEKRAEAQIARASNTPDFEILEEARFSSQVYPRKKRNYLLAIIAGLFFPAVFLKTREIFRTKLVSQEELEKISGYPVINKLLHHSGSSPVIFKDHQQTRIAENLRSIRLNLDFCLINEGCRVIQVTSSSAEEGKSFIALNLGSAYAANRQKTLVIGFDMRKPSELYKEFYSNHLLGLSHYLGNKADIDDIIFPSHIPDLDLIVSKLIPPNPFDLLSSNRTRELISYVRKTYDCVIIDSAPAALVPDAFYLMKYADINLVVARHNFTSKKLLTETLNEFEKKNVNNLYLIYNNIPLSKANLSYHYY
jgi:tyrosine-protein kinase Etk/Wzc